MTRPIMIALLALVTATGCEEKLRPPVMELDRTELPSQESWNSTVTFSDSARVNAILRAGHIAVYQPQQYTLLDDSIQVDFFDETGNHTSRLTALRGRVNDQTRDFEAYEHVVVRSDDGTTLTTERLFWTNSTRTIHTDAYVEITSPTEQIRGVGMESDQSLRNYKIFRVTGQAVTKE